MKKEQEKRLDQQEADEKVESRLGLKNKLYNLGVGDFDLSEFTESNNEQHRINSLFPQNNEPTLQDSEPGEHFKIGEDSGLQQYYGQGVTARNSYQKGKSNSSQIYSLQMKVDQLTQEMALQGAELTKYKNTNQILKKEVDRLQRELQRKGELIESQRRQIGELKCKESALSSGYQSKHSNSSKSSMSDSLTNFCAQLLSPEQTVQLLNQLLKKVSKSSRMMKSLTGDSVIKQMLVRMSKG